MAEKKNALDQRILRTVQKAARVLKSQDASIEQRLAAVGALAGAGAVSSIEEPNLRRYAADAMRELADISKFGGDAESEDGQ